MTEYSFVLDINDKKLAPCNINKAWYLIRKNKAILIQKIPMVIKLKKEVEETNVETICGIDDGSKNVGVALVQKCKTCDYTSNDDRIGAMNLQRKCIEYISEGLYQ